MSHLPTDALTANRHASRAPAPLEMWGGVECSYVRVGDRIVDQFSVSGHDLRLDDLDRFAALGLRTLRYPISWERMAAGRIDWAWAGARLERMRALGIRPIVGFVHHGGGPHAEGLLSPQFATGLAAFAREVAKRFPWIDAYTPVNEPGTTARFSGLYGFWYPHGRDVRTFARCLLHQTEGTRLAMRAIRESNPHALLVQTEDVGKTHARPLLNYQSDFENERRWLSYDLLCGRVDARHPLRRHLVDGGISEAALASLCADPCPPDILGMNHYVTSERFLDERVHLYPPEFRGGNGQHQYADIPALRVRLEDPVGPHGLLRELWDRYHLPIAITEVQIACGREDQLRWLHEVWSAAQDVRAEGADVRAVTAWALLGAHEWDSLLTASRGHYETGAFDLRSTPPRRTAVAHAIHALATAGEFDHPALSGPGWWRRPERLTYPPVSAPRTGTRGAIHSDGEKRRGPPLLVVGARGTLGRAFLQAGANRGLPVIAITRSDADLIDIENVRRVLALHRPWAVVNCAGYVRVDAAEADVAACERDNVQLAATWATACAEHDVKFLTFSSDLVFDGATDHPYVESAPPLPLSVYGRSKVAAERAVAAVGSSALVVRTSAFFGADDDANFARHILRELAQGRDAFASPDQTISPTFVPELVDAALDLMIDDERGVWHLANAGAVTWFEWARAIARLAGCSSERIQAGSPAAVGWIAPRPRFSALGSERGQVLSTWERALERYFADLPTRMPGLAA